MLATTGGANSRTQRVQGALDDGSTSVRSMSLTIGRRLSRRVAKIQEQASLG